MNITDLPHWKKFSPSDGHYFFGYYDRTSWDYENSLHLALKVAQCERLPLPGETAEIGVIDRNTSEYTGLTTTRTWCHQQGAMTLWLKHLPGCFIYNDLDEKSGRICAKIYSMKDGVTGSYDRPIYAMSPDGKYGASLNFARIPRRGYSYADAALEPNDVPDMDNDGIFLVEMETGKSELVIPYRKMIDMHPVPYALENSYIWLNHIIFNSDSSKLLFLLRHSEDKETFCPWYTHMYTANLDGSNLACPLPHFYWKDMISHQIWGRGPNEILVDANWRDKGHEYVVFDESSEVFRAELISKGIGPMSHLVFSPNEKWMLADTYPQDGIQKLALVKVETGELKIIGQFNHRQPATYPIDVRCDLHPRWSRDGQTITVDSIDDGKRGIYLTSLKDIKF